MYRLIQPAADAILTGAEVKDQVRVEADTADYDGVLETCRAAAEAWARESIGGPLLPETWTATFRRPDCHGRLLLERGPHLAVAKVEMLQNRVWVEQDAALWTVRGVDRWTSIVKPAPLAGGAAGYWPTFDRDEEAFRVTFTAGYADRAAVPAPIVAAILLMVGHLFANRSATSPSNLVVNPALEAMLWPYRRIAL